MSISIARRWIASSTRRATSCPGWATPATANSGRASLAKTLDWQAWHADYDSDTPLRRRLEIVKKHIRKFLEEFHGSPVRVVSMCAGEARDLLGAVAAVQRRDLVGRLVELNPELAKEARRHAAALGLRDLEVVVGDAGHTGAYAGAVPADLVLVCGVFGNISNADVRTTVESLPMLCAQDATVIWTRHRRKPDLTPSIRKWLNGAGLEELAFEPVPDSPGAVGVARYAGKTAPWVDRKLFVFNRTYL